MQITDSNHEGRRHVRVRITREDLERLAQNEQGRIYGQHKCEQYRIVRSSHSSEAWRLDKEGFFFELCPEVQDGNYVLALERAIDQTGAKPLIDIFDIYGAVVPCEVGMVFMQVEPLKN